MIDISNETQEFVKKLKESKEYIQFAKAKEALKSEEGLEEKVDEFRKRSFEIQIAHNYGYYDSYEQILHLRSEYETLLSNPIVDQFLATELALSKLISMVYDCIAKNIDLGLGFLKE